MIRVRRRPVFAYAVHLRMRELLRIEREARDPQAPDEKELGRAYQEHKELLFCDQKSKCCYCETRVPLHFSDVEHFRPKLRAKRGSGYPTYGYWWLAFTWENLLFACATCNRSHKDDQFPLHSGSVVLKVFEEPEGGEKPLLLDPASLAPADHPMNHIQFRPFRDANGKEKWKPFGRSPRGEKTIDVLGLDRPALIELYGEQARDIDGEIRNVRKTVVEDDRAGMLRHWHALLDRFFLPTREFIALSYDVVEHRMPAEERARLGLPLPDRLDL